MGVVLDDCAHSVSVTLDAEDDKQDDEEAG